MFKNIVRVQLFVALFFIYGCSGDSTQINQNDTSTINTSEKMYLSVTQGKRAEEFKRYVKVLVNELLLTIK